MGVVLFAMGGYGTFLGWYMRMNPKEKMELAPGPALGAVQHQCVSGTNMGNFQIHQIVRKQLISQIVPNLAVFTCVFLVILFYCTSASRRMQCKDKSCGHRIKETQKRTKPQPTTGQMNVR